LRRGGHDPEKIYAAYKWATTQANGKPTAILAKTVKAGRRSTCPKAHRTKRTRRRTSRRHAVLKFLDLLQHSESDDKLTRGPRPTISLPKNSPEVEYLPRAGVRRLAAMCPAGLYGSQEEIPTLQTFDDHLKGRQHAATRSLPPHRRTTWFWES
jgi:pyruvate dehydrogenase E1 component